MVEGSVASSEWPTFSLQQLEQPINGAKSANKNLFMWDKNGSVGVFMRYKGHLCELGPEFLKVTLGRQTAQDVGEVIRKSVVACMRSGENCCLDVDRLSPDFAAATKEGTFDADKFFDWAWLNQRDNYIQYVRDEENHGVGGLNPGHYTRSDSFCLIIRSGAENEASLAETIAKIPHFNSDFHHVIIQ